ncbi:MAG: alpha-amylase family glycosyl hydrolase [Melioribacteraceae bacterium]|nr:MAG: alpha-amylase family glycosyl hydrolase [Melioribacteraceae bacterium]
MKLYSNVIFLLGLFFFLGCSQKTNSDIKDVIPVVKLLAGQTDSILVSDLFYAENYDLTFKKNPNIKIDYLKESKTLVLQAGDDYEGMTLVDFDYSGQTYSIPVTVELLQSHTFSFAPNKKYNSINLFGSFNQWNRQNLPMTDEDGNGTYEITLPFEAGVYEYKFFADGEELLDPSNPEKRPNGIGGENSIIKIEPRHTDEIYLHQLKYEEEFNQYIFEFENKSKETFINTDNVVALVNNKKVESTNLSVNGSIVKIKLDKPNGENLIRVGVTNNGQVSNIQYVHTYDGKPIDNNYWTWYDGVIYSLMVDRFYDGDLSLNNPIKHDSLADKANYMGGDLQGIINKINAGYFDSLSVNVIWISPVYDNPNEAYREYPEPHRYFSGYHGYWPIHHLNLEEKFGSMDKLKELIKTAHSKNIKVLLDFVSNHVHKDHQFYKNHPEWFGQLELPDGRLNLRFWDEFRLTTWFEPYLPSFDYIGSQEALDVMTENAVWWLKSTGADGFRHDAVKHVPNEFWRELTRKIKKEISDPENKYVYQIGETFGDYELVSSYVNNGQLSSQFNFELYNTAQAAFIDPDYSFKNLDDEIKKTSEVYGTIHYMGNIMDSHDKNRFMAYTDGDLELAQWSAVEEGWNNPPRVDDPKSYDKMKLYMAYMNSIPGLPVIYYGSEFGMTGASDPDNRRMMRFGNELNEYEKETLQDVREIVNLRKEHPALRYGDYYNIKADENIFAYIRSYMNERILVVINKNENPQNVELNLPPVYNANEIVNLTSDEVIRLSNSVSNFNMDGISWKMFLIK